MAAADHEANLLAHPYIGLEHLELGRLGLAGRTAERDALRSLLKPGVQRRWWRPRVPAPLCDLTASSATENLQRMAEHDEDEDKGL